MKSLVYKKKNGKTTGFWVFFLGFWSEALALCRSFWYTYFTDEMNIVPYLLPKFGRWGKGRVFFLCTLAI